mgnify:CR=1 FL=1
MKKRILSVLLVLVMLMCSMPVTVFATQSRVDYFSKNYSLSGNAANDMIAIAQAQLGKTVADLGYTEAWCANFVSDCAKLAGQSSAVPANGYVPTFYNAIISAGGKKVSSPQKGDIIFYNCSACDTNGDGLALMHVGIVMDSTYSIEGNYNNKVSKASSYTDEYGHKTSTGTVKRIYLRPAYKESSKHTVDSNYGKNYTDYLKNPSGKTTVYSSCGIVASGHYISGKDPVTIHEVYTDGCCKVSYTTDSGATRTYYAKISDFIGKHTHSYTKYYEAAHPHKEYNKCSCGDWYYLGTNKNVSSCKECNPSINYEIKGRYTNQDGKFYDSNLVEITITPKVGDRDAYDSEIISITLKIKCPDGKVLDRDYGTAKTKVWYFAGYELGDYTFYADVKTTKGSYAGSENNNSISLKLEGPSLTRYSYTTNEVIYRRIQFSDLNTYLTVDANDNAVSSSRSIQTSENQNQVWKLIKNSDNSYTIVSLENNKALDVEKGRYAQGSNVLTYTQQNSDNQKWEICKKGYNGYYIKPLKSGSAVLDVTGGVNTEGTNIELWSINDSVAQKVTFLYPYQITYDANGGTNAPQSQEKDYNSEFLISTEKPVRSGYDFVGWSTSSSATNATYYPGGSYTKMQMLHYMRFGKKFPIFIP